jgi:fructuronate reductase
VDPLSLTTLGSVAQHRRHDAQPEAFPIVHLGPGAFHRAHQAIYCDEILQAGHDDWGIVAVSSRSDAAVEALERQDGLFSVAVQSSNDGFDDLRVCRSIGAWRHRRQLAESIASSEVLLVTSTVTEAAYRPSNGSPLSQNSLLESVVAGLLQRWRSGGAPLGFLPCDNLVDNGDRLRRALKTEAVRAEAPPGYFTWVDEHVSFASSVVDRVVPAPGPADRARVAAELGVLDELAEVTEPFSLWVFEDRFAAGRPPWEVAGAIPVTDVRAYEDLKLRVLNAAHSMVAYLGLLAGHRMVSEAMNDPAIYSAVAAFHEHEALVTLQPLVGLDPTEYADTARQRFLNPGLPYTLAQVASSGSVKIPERMLPMVADLIAAGRVPYYCALAVAAWVRLVEIGASGPTPFSDQRQLDLSNRCRGQSARQLVADLVGALDGEAAQIVVADAPFLALAAEHVEALRAGGLDSVLDGPRAS